MATIDEVYNTLINFKNGALTRFNELETKIDILIARNNLSHICTVCHGTGKVIPPFNSGDPLPGEIECSICLGEGYLEWVKEQI